MPPPAPTFPSHFESVSDDVLSIYERVTGEPLDMNINADTTEVDE